VVRHEQRVDVGAVPAVVASAHALALEPEALIEPYRGLVPGEDVELELADARVLRPAHGGAEQRAADAAPPMGGGDHEAQVRDMGARGMGVPGERETADDGPFVLLDRDEHRGVSVPADSLQIAPLVCDAAPRLRRQEPLPGLAADGGCEAHQITGVLRLRPSNGDHGTTTP